MKFLCSIGAVLVLIVLFAIGISVFTGIGYTITLTPWFPLEPIQKGYFVLVDYFLFGIMGGAVVALVVTVSTLLYILWEGLYDKCSDYWEEIATEGSQEY